jgi:hypothetical protein
MFSLAEEPAVRAIEVKNGMLLCFTLVAQSSNGERQKFHRYNSSLYVRHDDVEKWKKRLEPGKVFLITGGEWRMPQKDDFKFPIPQLSLTAYNFKALKTPWWVEDNPDE